MLHAACSRLCCYGRGLRPRFFRCGLSVVAKPVPDGSTIPPWAAPHLPGMLARAGVYDDLTTGTPLAWRRRK
jgi:hypothetical protein